MRNEETSSRVADRMSRRFDREDKDRVEDSEPTTDSEVSDKAKEKSKDRVGSQSNDSTEDQVKTDPVPDIDENSQQNKEFIDTLIAERRAIEKNRNRKVVSVTDPLWSSLLTALEDHPDQKRELLESLNINNMDPSRSEISRKVLYAGLQSIAPDLYEDLTQAEAKRAVEDL